MKKKILLILALVLVVAIVALVLLNVCFRKITVISGKQFVHKCPRYARPGQEVTVLTSVVSDAELYVNGVDGEFRSPGKFVFTMPDRDVELKATVIAFRDGA